MFSTSRNKCSRLVLKSCKFDQETSEEVLFIKARQNPFYRDLMLKLNKSLTQAVYVENYEIKFSKFDNTQILEYLCKVSSLTTLDIYKDYFKGHHKVVTVAVTCIVWPEIEFVLVHLSLCKSYCILIPRVCDQWASWSSSLMNWRTLQPIILL